MTYDPKRGLSWRMFHVHLTRKCILLHLDTLTPHLYQWTDLRKKKKKQKINNKTQTLNDTLDKTDLLDILRTFHLNTFMYYPPLSILISFMLRSILSDIRIATTDFLYIFISSYFQSVYVSWFEMDLL